MTGEILANATPRPWDRAKLTTLLENIHASLSNRDAIVVRERAVNDLALMTVAVNSYEPLREALRKAVEALEAVIRFNDAFPGEVEVALVKCREVLGEE